MARRYYRKNSTLRLRLGRRRARAGLAAAPLAHEVVELGAILGHAQPLQERAELLRLLLQPAQGLVAVFIEGAVAAGPHARRSAPLLHPPLPALALALPPLGGALAPLLHVMSSASHPSAPYEIGQDRQPDGPEHDEADHHQGDPCRPSEVVYSRYNVSHCRLHLSGFI